MVRKLMFFFFANLKNYVSVLVDVDPSNVGSIDYEQFLEISKSIEVSPDVRFDLLKSKFAYL